MGNKLYKRKFRKKIENVKKMKLENILKEDYKRYLELRKYNQKLIPSSNKTFPKIKEIRNFNTFPPIYFLITEESFKTIKGNIYKVIPLTEFISLAYLDNTPIFNFKNIPLCLVPLPFWLYFSEKILFEYSEVIAKTNEESIRKCIQYVEKTKIPSKTSQGKYIQDELERLGKLSLYSLLINLEKIEES